MTLRGAHQDRSPIGRRVQARRRMLGMTTVELARRLGCSTGRVHNIECYGVGTLDLVEQLARALDTDPRELAFGPYTDDEARADRERHQRAVDRWLGQLAP